MGPKSVTAIGNSIAECCLFFFCQVCMNSDDERDLVMRIDDFSIILKTSTSHVSIMDNLYTISSQQR